MSEQQQQPSGEPKIISEEVAKLTSQVAQLCAHVRGLVQLQAVMDRKLDTALKGGIGADFAVLG